MPEDNIFENNIKEEPPCEEVSQEVSRNENEEVLGKKPPDFAAFFTNAADIAHLQEKMSIKKSAKTIGLAFLIMQIFVLTLNIALVVTFQLLALFGVVQINILNDFAFLQAQQIIFSSICFTLPFIISFKAAKIRISDLIEFSAPDKKTALPFFLFGIAFCAFANIASSAAGNIFESFGIGYSVDFLENPKGIFGFLLSFIATAITPALVEEFACRGLVLGHLRKYGEGFAIIVSSILFALMHGNFEQIPFAFLIGLALGYITVKSGSIWLAVSVHAFNNFISVAFDYFFSSISAMSQSIIYTFFLIFCLLAGIIGVLLLRGNNEAYKLNASDSKLAEKEKYKLFFSSAAVIIFIVICLVEAFSFFII